MLFQLGAEVRGPEGTKLGELHRVVYDIETAQVVSLVVTHSSLDGREVLIPRGTVQSSDNEYVELAISEERFSEYRDFESHRNVAPLPDSQNAVSDTVDDPSDLPDVPPIGAATGIESIAFVPLIEETYAIRVGEAVLAHDTAVYATDGEVGRVKQVTVSDDTYRITELVVESGFFFKHDTEIPFEYVENVVDDSIVLTVAKAELEALNVER